jgi:Flp pilus assembly protein TadG
MMIANLIRRWKSQTQGAAMMEAAILFPVLLTMLFGVYDIGHAITANHKMITASQVAADLITRTPSVSTDELNQAIEAAGLAMAPYADGSSIGIDIISVRFDEDDNPQQVWRETRNMNINQNDAALEKSRGLGTEGEGAMIVTVLYDYVPTFGNVVIKNFRLRETAFARGRRSSVVSRE